MFSKYSTKKVKTHRHYSKSNQIVNKDCINRKDLIFEEADQNEFVFDAKDMAEIASQKKERFIDKQRTVRKRSFLCCGINSSIGGSRSSDTTGPENSNKKAGNFRSRKRTLKQNMFGSNTESECTIF